MLNRYLVCGVSTTPLHNIFYLHSVPRLSIHSYLPLLLDSWKEDIKVTLYVYFSVDSMPTSQTMKVYNFLVFRRILFYYSMLNVQYEIWPFTAIHKVH